MEFRSYRELGARLGHGRRESVITEGAHVSTESEAKSACSAD